MSLATCPPKLLHHIFALACSDGGHTGHGVSIALEQASTSRERGLVVQGQRTTIVPIPLLNVLELRMTTIVASRTRPRSPTCRPGATRSFPPLPRMKICRPFPRPEALRPTIAATAVTALAPRAHPRDALCQDSGLSGWHTGWVDI
jgi:hypothetical protein